MKQEINLLGPHHRKERTRRLYMQRANNIVSSCIAGAAIILAAYGGIAFVLQQMKELSEDHSPAQVGSTSESSQEIRELNPLLKDVQQQIRAHTPMSDRLPAIVLAAPPNIAITEIALTRDPNSIIIKGKSRSRAAIVEYQQALEELENISGIQAPLQNLASGSEIPFTFMLTLP